MVYALSRNPTALQPDFQRNIFGHLDQFVIMSVSIQQVDNCNKNQNVI